MGGLVTTHAIFKMRSKTAASVLHISVKLSYAIDSESAMFILMRRDAEAILFHMDS